MLGGLPAFGPRLLWEKQSSIHAEKIRLSHRTNRGFSCTQLPDCSKFLLECLTIHLSHPSSQWKGSPAETTSRRSFFIRNPDRCDTGIPTKCMGSYIVDTTGDSLHSPAATALWYNHCHPSVVRPHWRSSESRRNVPQDTLG